MESDGTLGGRRPWTAGTAGCGSSHASKHTPVFLPGESQGRQSLVGCCLWGRTELDIIPMCGVSSCSSWALEYRLKLLGLSCFKACGIFRTVPPGPGRAGAGSGRGAEGDSGGGGRADRGMDRDWSGGRELWSSLSDFFSVSALFLGLCMSPCSLSYVSC